MDTFLNLHTEREAGDTARIINIMLTDRNLNARIMARGHREQYAAMLQPYTKRKLIKGSFCSGARTFSRYS